MAPLPAYLANKQASTRVQDALAVFGSPQPPSISMRGGKLSFVDESGNQELVETFAAKKDRFGVQGVYLDCVLIDMNPHISKVWFDKPFDPNGDWTPPDCWSDNGIGASRQASRPQSALCSTCPNNVWGSAVSNISGKGTKACHDVQKFALLIPGDDTVYQLRVPPNSRKNMREYLGWFRDKGAVDYTDVLTCIYFDPDQQFTLKFVAKCFLDDELVRPVEDKIWERRDRVLAVKETDTVVGRNDVAVRASAHPVDPPPPQLAQRQAERPFEPQTAPVEPTRQRRRRTIAPETPAQSSQQAEAVRAPFLPQPGVQQNGPAPPNHGMAHGAAPDADMTAAIDSLFGPAK